MAGPLNPPRGLSPGRVPPCTAFPRRLTPKPRPPLFRQSPGRAQGRRLPPCAPSLSRPPPPHPAPHRPRAPAARSPGAGAFFPAAAHPPPPCLPPSRTLFLKPPAPGPAGQSAPPGRCGPPPLRGAPGPLCGAPGPPVRCARPSVRCARPSVRCARPSVRCARPSVRCARPLRGAPGVFSLPFGKAQPATAPLALQKLQAPRPGAKGLPLKIPFFSRRFFCFAAQKKGAPARITRAGAPFFLFPCKTRAGRRRGVLFSLF